MPSQFAWNDLCETDDMNENQNIDGNLFAKLIGNNIVTVIENKNI